MHYTRILQYRRGVGVVYPVIVTKAHGYEHVAPVSWPSLYGGHTEWIARDIEERANAPRRRHA